jgi:Mn2+/Fe2+ NRAMP family transporter
VINAVISVPIMVAVMIAASRSDIMGRHVMEKKWRVLGWIATGAMTSATLAMAWTLAT